MEAARQATTSDVADLVRLAAHARNEARQQRGGALWLALDGRSILPAETVHELLADELHEVVVGTVDDAVVGYAVARAGGPVAAIEELFVEREAREVGVGEALVNYLLDWARQAGCRGIDSFALPGDRAMKNLFERFGMVARAIIVHKPLEEL